MRAFCVGIHVLPAFRSESFFSSEGLVALLAPRSEARRATFVNLCAQSCVQWVVFSVPTDVPHIGADTPIAPSQWSTRNTKMALIFQ